MIIIDSLPAEVCFSVKNGIAFFDCALMKLKCALPKHGYAYEILPEDKEIVVKASKVYSTYIVLKKQRRHVCGKISDESLFLKDVKKGLRNPFSVLLWPMKGVIKTLEALITGLPSFVDDSQGKELRRITEKCFEKTEP